MTRAIFPYDVPTKLPHLRRLAERVNGARVYLEVELHRLEMSGSAANDEPAEAAQVAAYELARLALLVAEAVKREETRHRSLPSSGVGA